MALSQKVAFNTFIQIVSKIASVMFSLLTTILLTGWLGKEGYGDYMYVITLVILFGSFADWGTATIGVREAAKEKKNQGRILANLIVLRLILSVFAAGLMVLFSFLAPIQTSNPAIMRKGIILGSVILILIATKVSLGIIFQARLQMEKLAFTEIISSFLTFLLSWLFVKEKLGLLAFISAVIIATSASGLVAAILAREIIELRLYFDKPLFKKIIIESLPMGAILLMFTVDNKIDTIMLGILKGSDSVAIYSIAYRIYDVLILASAYLMKALLPVLSQYSDIKKWKAVLRETYQKAFDSLVLMGLAASLVICFFAPLMVRVLTQQKYPDFFDSANVLKILALAMILSYFNHLTGYTIVALGKQRSYFYVALSSLIFNVFANLLVIPHFSYFGAAWVTVLTELLVLATTSIFIFRLIGIFPSLIKFPQTAIQAIKSKGKIF